MPVQSSAALVIIGGALMVAGHGWRTMSEPYEQYGPKRRQFKREWTKFMGQNPLSGNTCMGRAPVMPGEKNPPKYEDIANPERTWTRDLPTKQEDKWSMSLQEKENNPPDNWSVPRFEVWTGRGIKQAAYLTPELPFFAGQPSATRQPDNDPRQCPGGCPSARHVCKALNPGFGLKHNPKLSKETEERELEIGVKGGPHSKWFGSKTGRDGPVLTY